ncbi:MAG TPA: hypothetical protein VF595_05455 [Tepidisphaeraceae bacterium]|jgi:hypothetical protein
MNPPIKRRAHGAMDYGLVAAQFVLPSLLNLKGPARTLSYLFAGTQLAVNAMTDQPLAAKKALPFKTHGTLDAATAPLLLTLPLLTGAIRERKAGAYFFGVFGALAATYVLTDWNAPREHTRFTQYSPKAKLERALARS